MKCPFCERSISTGAATCPHCQAPIAGLTSPVEGDLESRIRALLDQRQKIEAIKVYREATGSSLADAKQAVEAFAEGSPLMVREKPEPGDYEAEVLRLLSEGRKIQAIKLYRERMGVGLKDSKEAVEALAKRHGVAATGSGCLGVLLLLAVTATIAVMFAFGK